MPVWWCLAVHLTCSGRGICDTSAGTCTCFEGYDGQSCGETDLVWTSFNLAVLYLHPQLASYSANVLHLMTERPASSSFYHIYVESAGVFDTFSMRGDGFSKLHRVRI